MLDVCILGPLRLSRDGVEVPLTAAKQRTLVLIFATRPLEILSVDRLIDVLWPDDPPESARKLIHVYVSQLRAALGSDAIATVAGGYRFAASLETIDARRFELLCAEAQHAIAAGAAARARALANRAIALWCGPALADVATDPAFAGEAARLVDLLVDCQAARIDAELALGEHLAALPELRQLCAAHPFREHLRGRLAVALYRCGRQSDALAELVAARRDLLEARGLDPGRGLADLERAILDQDPALDAPPANDGPSMRLPEPLTRLVGRGHETELIGGLLLRDDVRLVTVAGSGGSGKTRVALAVARSVARGFADGVVFVELAALHDPRLVVGAIAAAIGVAESPEESSVAALATWLSGRDVLLVIDNFEHVIDAADELARLLVEAPRLTLLVTSRRVLHLTGEHVVPLNPLPISDAMVLFRERAAERGRVLPEGGGGDAVRAICARLDGLPLAIELAAARTSMLSPVELVGRLAGSISDLGIGPRDAPARQRTLDETLRWSTDLLSPAQRRVLARCSVFSGGCTIAAAESVGETSLDALGELVDSSLLQRTTSDDTRLAMLETVRGHALGLFEGAAEQAEAEWRHHRYFVELAESLVLKGDGQSEGLATVDADIDNFRLVMDRAESAGDDVGALRVATALYRYWYLRGMFREGCDRITRPLLRGGGDVPLRALALRAVAGLRFLLGEFDASQALALAGIDAAQEVGDHVSIVACNTVLGHIAKERGAFGEAGEHFRRSEVVAELAGLAEDVVIANTNLGELAFATGDLVQARWRWEASLVNQGGPEANLTFALLGLGALSVREGQLDEGERYLIRARELSERAGFTHNTAMALIALAEIAAARGQHERAAGVIGDARDLLAMTGGQLTVQDADSLDQTTVAVRAHLGSDRFEELVMGDRRGARAEDSIRAAGQWPHGS